MTRMRALTGDLLLEAFERCTTSHDLARGLIMLEIAMPVGEVRLGSLPLGELNLLLLRLHELTFGPWLSVFGSCSHCGAEFEFVLPAADVAAELSSQLAEPQVWREDGRQYRLRAATLNDLLATATAPDMITAQEMLLERCLNASSAGPARDDLLPRFAEVNAASEFTCLLDCVACSNTESLDLDIARFVWAQVRVAARGLLGEVHLLASAYGWSEQTITAMSAGRRAAYLEMLAA